MWYKYITNFNREEILDQVDHRQKTDNFQEKDQQRPEFFMVRIY
ncbi:MULTISPECIES: hypothetical protein [Nostocales]|nr:MULTISPECIES: hypothetical protein [Nostocales]MCX5984436.1 hypothetical protein [Nostocales cyanobacterium LacPavin_0920_SED1_MAG_38_18]